MKANEDLQSHGNGKISTLLRNVSQIVLMGAASLFLYFLMLAAILNAHKQEERAEARSSRINTSN